MKRDIRKHLLIASTTLIALAPGAYVQDVLDWEKGYSYSVGAVIAGDKIISVISGCYILAHDLNTGEEL